MVPALAEQDIEDTGLLTEDEQQSPVPQKLYQNCRNAVLELLAAKVRESVSGRGRSDP